MESYKSYKIKPDIHMAPLCGRPTLEPYWDGTLPEQMLDAIMHDTKEDLMRIYGDMIHQMSKDETNIIYQAMQYSALRAAQRVYIEYGGCQIESAPQNEE